MSTLSRVVLLEGAEGSGKSTVATLLEKRGWASVHFSHHQSGRLLTYWPQTIRQTAKRSESGKVVVDRMLLSHLVYGNLIRGRVDLFDFDVWYLAGWLKKYGGVTCLLNPKDADYTDKEVARKFAGIITPKAIRDRFEYEIRNIDIKPVIRGTNRNSADWARLIDRLKPLPEIEGLGLGSRNPNVWFIGDELGTWSIRLRLLHRILKILNTSWSHVHISYSHYEGKMNHLEAMHEALGKPRIVFVGDKNAFMNSTSLSGSLIQNPKDVDLDTTSGMIDYAKKVRYAMGDSIAQ